MNDLVTGAATRYQPFWMPFTANRKFKAAPRMLVRAEGMYYWTEAGEKIERAVDQIYAGGIRPMEFGGSNGTADITKAVLAAL